MSQTLGQRIKESFLGIRSSDSYTRKMSVVFILSCLGVLFTLGFTVSYFYQQNLVRQAERARQDELEKKRKLEKEEEEKKKSPPVYVSVGTFVLELKDEPGVIRSRSSNHSAEFEMVLACRDPFVCEWVQANLDLTRGSLSSLFVPMERDQILSIHGKKAFREEIRIKINQLLKSKNIEGEVVDVFFPRFISS